jgi:hypothetical protein
MSLDLPDSLIETLILPLTALLLAASGNDNATAKANALKLIEVHDPTTVIELRLAVRIELFNIRANQTASEAGTRDLSPEIATRVTAGAISLTREADKAERRLEKLKTARPQAQEEPRTQSFSPASDPDPERESPLRDPQAVAEEIKQITVHAQANGLPFAKAYKQRKLEKRLALRQERDARLQAASQPAIAQSAIA